MITNFFIPAKISYKTKILKKSKQTTLSSLWRKATDGTSDNIDVQSSTKEHGPIRASYMVKYITKSCNNDAPEHGFYKFERRYGKSVGLFQMYIKSQGKCFLQFLNGDLAPSGVDSCSTDFKNWFKSSRYRDEDTINRFKGMINN